MVSKKSQRKVVRKATIKEASAARQNKRGVASRAKALKAHTDKIKKIKKSITDKGKTIHPGEPIGKGGGIRQKPPHRQKRIIHRGAKAPPASSTKHSQQATPKRRSNLE